MRQNKISQLDLRSLALAAKISADGKLLAISEVYGNTSLSQIQTALMKFGSVCEFYLDCPEPGDEYLVTDRLIWTIAQQKHEMPRIVRIWKKEAQPKNTLYYEDIKKFSYNGIPIWETSAFLRDDGSRYSWTEMLSTEYNWEYRPAKIGDRDALGNIINEASSTPYLIRVDRNENTISWPSFSRAESKGINEFIANNPNNDTRSLRTSEVYKPKRTREVREKLSECDKYQYEYRQAFYGEEKLSPELHWATTFVDKTLMIYWVRIRRVDLELGLNTISIQHQGNFITPRAVYPEISDAWWKVLIDREESNYYLGFPNVGQVYLHKESSLWALRTNSAEIFTEPRLIRYEARMKDYHEPKSPEIRMTATYQVTDLDIYGKLVELDPDYRWEFRRVRPGEKFIHAKTGILSVHLYHEHLFFVGWVRCGLKAGK